MARQWLSGYHELQPLICLETARDVGNGKTRARGPPGVRSTRPAPPEMGVADEDEDE